MIAPLSRAAKGLFEAAASGLGFLFERGFAPMLVPLVFPARDNDGAGIRFLDGEGRLWAVRSDFTPIVARSLAHELVPGRALRVCYAGEVARWYRAQLRGATSVFQLGFETFGVEAGGQEALEHVLDLLEYLGVPFSALTASISHAALGAEVLRQLLEDAPDAELLGMLMAKDVDGLVQRLGLHGSSARHLREALLDDGDEWVGYFGVETRWARIRGVQERVQARGLAVGFDLASPLAGSYYTGLVFSLWSKSRKELLAAGGEYEVDEGHGRVPAAGAALALERVVEEVPC